MEMHVEAISELLRSKPSKDVGKVLLESILMPSWTEAPAGGSKEFALALMDLSKAVSCETQHASRFNRVDFAPRTTSSYLPACQRHLPH
eukprot:2545064-Amphidinium_carterae.1